MKLLIFFQIEPPSTPRVSLVLLTFFLNGMEGRRKRRCDVLDSVPNTEEQIYQELRQVQLLTGCTTKTLNVMLEKLHPFLKGCEDVKKMQMPRVRARKLSRFKKQLHGCVGADCSYVFGPENKEVHCPECGVARYLLDGKPKEVSHSLFQPLSHIYIYIYLL